MIGNGYTRTRTPDSSTRELSTNILNGIFTPGSGVNIGDTRMIANNPAMPTSNDNSLEALGQALLNAGKGISQVANQSVEDARFQFAEKKQAEAEAKQASREAKYEAEKASREQYKTDRINASLQKLKDFDLTNPESEGSKMIASFRSGERNWDQTVDYAKTQIDGLSDGYKAEYLSAYEGLLRGIQGEHLKKLTNNFSDESTDSLVAAFTTGDYDTESLRKTIDGIYNIADTNMPHLTPDQRQDMKENILYNSADVAFSRLLAEDKMENATDLMEALRSGSSRDGENTLFSRMGEARKSQLIARWLPELNQKEKYLEGQAMNNKLDNNIFTTTKTAAKATTLDQLEQMMSDNHNEAKDVTDPEQIKLINAKAEVLRNRWSQLSFIKNRFNETLQLVSTKANAMIKKASPDEWGEGGQQPMLFGKDGQITVPDGSRISEAMHTAASRSTDYVMGKELDPNGKDAREATMKIFNEELGRLGFSPIGAEEQQNVPFKEITKDMLVDNPKMAETFYAKFMSDTSGMTREQIVSTASKIHPDKNVTTWLLDRINSEERNRSMMLVNPANPKGYEPITRSEPKRSGPFDSGITGKGIDSFFRIKDGKLEYRSAEYSTDFNHFWLFEKMSYKPETIKTELAGVDAEKMFIVNALSSPSGDAQPKNPYYRPSEIFSGMLDDDFDEMRQGMLRYRNPRTLNEMITDLSLAAPQRQKDFPQAINELVKDGVIKKTEDGKYQLINIPESFINELYSPEKNKHKGKK